MRIRMPYYLRIIWLIGLLPGWASAEGAGIPTPAELMEKYRLHPGLQITTENAHLIKDLVPEAVYRRVVAGDYAFTIGQFDPPDILTKVWPNEFYQEMERHAGKYDVDTDGGITDKATGERPWPMPYGLPFPQIDLTQDPKKVGIKIQWNSFAMSGAYNEVDTGGFIYSAPNRGPYDRYMIAKALRQYIDFRLDPITIDRPLSFQEVLFFLEPSDAFGTASLTWRWKDSKKWDSVWNYSPSTRRVRRLTSANRSDAVLGMEWVQDDANNYNGKVEMFEFKYVGVRATLMPFQRLESQADGDFIVKWPTRGKSSSRYSQAPNAFEWSENKQSTFPWKETPQRYASWWMPNFLWVPVWAYIVEGTPKDPYYNYGRQIFWYEANTCISIWKEIYNRSGEYWRTAWQYQEVQLFDGPDGRQRISVDNPWFAVVDEKTNRGIAGMDARDRAGNPSFKAAYNSGNVPDSLSLSRFLEFGK